MLFHVTMTHTEDNCPGYHMDKMPELVQFGDKLSGLAAELKVKIHFVLWGAPEHVAFALLEADNLAAVARIVNAIPILQSFKVTPVQNLQDTLTMAKAMMAQRVGR
jgi:hypothetical protein